MVTANLLDGSLPHAYNTRVIDEAYIANLRGPLFLIWREERLCSKDVQEEPLKSVIKNCQRLIRDAELLLEKGSAGSALSFAIMAFEEAGKGHSHELEAKHERRKTKIHSSHQFRHLMCALVLTASLSQKYGLKSPQFTDEHRERIKERYDSAANFSEFASSPAPEEIRQIVGKQILDQINALPHDRRIIAYVEFNWLRKITMASATGEVERLRQKGFYVDFDEQGLLSRPGEVTRSDAFTWIWTAKRAVNLLAFGIYHQPYSELAAFLEHMPKPLPDVENILRMMSDLAATNVSPLKEDQEEETDDEVKPYKPFGDSPEFG